MSNRPGPRLLVKMVRMGSWGTNTFRFQIRALQVIVHMSSVPSGMTVNGINVLALWGTDRNNATAYLELRPQYDASGSPLWYDIDWSFVMGGNSPAGGVTWTDFEPE